MHQDFYRKIGLIVIAVVALMGVAAAMHIFATLPIPEDQGAEFVAAIGTVFTLAVTIWLATSAERRRRKEQRDLAIIAAAELALWLKNLQLALHAAESMLPGHLSAPDDPRDAFADATKVIDDVGIWTREDLLPLVSLPGHTAARLVWTTAKIRSVVASLRRGSTRDDLDANIVTIHLALAKQLRGCFEELDAEHNELLEFFGSKRV